MNTTTFGLDIAKRAFQMYWVEAETGETVNRRFTKQQLIEFLGRGRSWRIPSGRAGWPADAGYKPAAKSSSSITAILPCKPGGIHISVKQDVRLTDNILHATILRDR